MPTLGNRTGKWQEAERLRSLEMLHSPGLADSSFSTSSAVCSHGGVARGTVSLVPGLLATSCFFHTMGVMEVRLGHILTAALGPERLLCTDVGRLCRMCVWKMSSFSEEGKGIPPTSD